MRQGTLTLVDVRFPGEWAQGAIPGAVNIPLDQLEERLGEIPRGGRVAVYCQSGMRSSTAASLLEGAGFDGVIDLIGGYASWSAAANLTPRPPAESTAGSSVLT